MNEKFIQQVIAEVITAQEQALGLLTAALCQQLDPARLHADLKGLIETAQKLPDMPPLAIRFAQAAQAAAETEKMLKARPAGEVLHPKRG